MSQKSLGTIIPTVSLLLVACSFVAIFIDVGWVPLTLLGFLAAFINVVAGGGSLLLIPALTFIGESAAITNGTIRLQILIQGVVALWAYRKSGLFDKAMCVAAIPVVLGAALGVLFITRRPDDDVRLLLGLAVLLAALFTVWTPTKGRGKHFIWLAIAAAGSGFYGGMVQAGTGYLFLTTATWVAGMDLVKANLAKLLWATAYAPLTIFLFHRADQINWSMAIAIAMGAIPGAFLGSKAAIEGGVKFIKWAVIVTALIGGGAMLVSR